MATQQIPSGNEGAGGRARAGNRACSRLFGRKSPAKRRDLRRNGPVRVHLPFCRLEYARGRRMTPAAPRHISVLGREAVEMLTPKAGGTYVDATFGAGGYSRAILAVEGTRVIGIDRDRSAVTGGFDLVDQSDGRLTLVEDRFSNLADICAAEGMAEVDGVVMDVGVSSMQLDQAERGFSFRLGGPLDMRMGRSGADAAALVNHAPARDLAAIIRIYGEEKKAGRLARAIERTRQQQPILSTVQLAEIITRAAGPAGAS